MEKKRTGEEIILNSCMKLSDDAQDFFVSSVREVDSISDLEFVFQVTDNVPLLIKGGIKHCPAFQKWGPDYFRNVIGDKLVSVAVTPNGYADAIATAPNGQEYFVEPEERQMAMSDFLNILEQPEATPGVFYIQQQNSNLTTEFEELINDIDEEVHFASKALRTKPAAVNFWMGDKRAVTSIHKDPFENLYCVVSGYKDFILHPPTDRPWIPYNTYPRAKYCEISPGKFEIIPVKKNPNTSCIIAEDSGLQKGLHGDDMVVGSCIRIDTNDNSLCIEHSDKPYLKSGLHDDDSSSSQSDQVLSGDSPGSISLHDDQSYERARHKLDQFQYVNKGLHDNEFIEGCSDILQVPWISVDPLNPNFVCYPQYRNATPLRVHVEAGDILYLPSLWFHHVQQSHGCIAINYWYDMQFDLKYIYYTFLDSLVPAVMSSFKAKSEAGTSKPKNM